jgi:hypothetical protein
MRSSKPKFTKQHYQFLAEALSESFASFDTRITPNAMWFIGREFSNQLKGTNPNYDPVRFMDAFRRLIADKCGGLDILKDQFHG